MLSSLWRLDGIPGARTIRHNLRAVAPIKSVAERGRRMWGEFNVEDNCGKSRPPTTVRIEVDLVKQRITVVWEILNTTKEIPFPSDEDSLDDVSNVLWLAHTAIEALEQCDPPERFVDGDTIQIWQATEAGRVLVAKVEVSVTPPLCGECANGHFLN